MLGASSSAAMVVGWTCSGMSAPAVTATLYERLGGVYSIATVVDDFIDRIMVDPRLNANPAVERLERLGAKIFVGHAAANVEGVHVLVYSSAVSRDNVEVQTARQNQVPTIPRAEMLAELMRLKSNIAIAGTHGKTTTTTMVATLLDKGGFDPTVINGGVIHAYGSNARAGAGETQDDGGAAGGPHESE